MIFTLEEGYLLTTTVPDLQCGIAPLGFFLRLRSQHSSGCSSRPPALASGVGGSSQLPPLAWGSGWLFKVTTPGLWRKVTSPDYP